MFIRNCLSPKKDLTLLTPTMTIGETLKRLGTTHYSLPVVSEEGTFLGILSKRSILEYYKSQPDTISLYELHQKNIEPCIDTEANKFVDLSKGHFEDCLPIVVRYPFVPVLDGKKFVGIIKRSLIEKTLASCFGVGVN